LWAVALRRAFSFPIRTLRASTPRCMSRPTRYGWRRTTREPRSVCRRRGRRGPSLQGTRPVPARYCFWVPHWFVSPGESLLQPAHGRSSRSSARIRHRAARCRQCRDSRTGMQPSRTRRRSAACATAPAGLPLNAIVAATSVPTTWIPGTRFLRGTPKSVAARTRADLRGTPGSIAARPSADLRGSSESFAARPRADFRGASPSVVPDTQPTARLDDT